MMFDSPHMSAPMLMRGNTPPTTRSPPHRSRPAGYPPNRQPATVGEEERGWRGPTSRRTSTRAAPERRPPQSGNPAYASFSSRRREMALSENSRGFPPGHASRPELLRRHSFPWRYGCHCPSLPRHRWHKERPLQWHPDSRRQTCEIGDDLLVLTLADFTDNELDEVYAPHLRRRHDWAILTPHVPKGSKKNSFLDRYGCQISTGQVQDLPRGGVVAVRQDKLASYSTKLEGWVAAGQTLDAKFLSTLTGALQCTGQTIHLFSRTQYQLDTTGMARKWD